jgi:hypothetical protein
MKKMYRLSALFITLSLCIILNAREYHVSVKGNDSNDGSPEKPFKTISAAARVAKPGDMVIVHAGTYRELIDPENGGSSESARIIYQAAPGEEVNIKGSEVVKNWEKVKEGIWKVSIPNTFFGSYNPYQDTILGDWFNRQGRIHHTGEVYLNGKSFYEVEKLEKVMNPALLKNAQDQEGSTFTWFCESNEKTTVIWANFHSENPNKGVVEINVRPSCFYPTKNSVNYLTIRGFHFSQAATQWAAPTAEQIGMVSTHWSKCWIIENNIINDSKCSGITLGKERSTGHNVWLADMSKDGSQHYNEVIFRALQIGWDKENIGSHIVRNNTIFNCEQTGICGSLGPVFSTVINNHIFNIWTKRQFSGAEIAGIKFHAAIDVLIKNNLINNCGRGIWMDWMAQGTRISCNILYNNTSDDIFIEVDHGPFIIDNNILLSPLAINIVSEGGAYIHNIIGGKISVRPEPNRFTPYHFPHSTKVAGLINILLGDDRYYNNIFTLDKSSATQNNKLGQYGLQDYSKAKYPVWIASNIYFNGIKPYSNEIDGSENAVTDPEISIEEKGNEVYLHINVDESLSKVKTRFITTSLLGKAKMPNVSYENPDGSELKIDKDFLGNKRSENAPLVGPFETLKQGKQVIKVW